MLAWATSVAFLLYGARGAFLFGRSSIGHDNLFWFYPVYQFFAGSLLHGRFPYWDPFTHGGEALYPVLLQLRLLEPISYLVLAVGSLATNDLTTLFLWDRLARGLVGALGAYVLLRQWTEFWAIRLLLPPLLVCSSFLLAVFHQTAVIDQFISAPWAAYFALRIVHAEDLRWRNWIGLAVFTGTAWQSYYFAGLWILFFFLALGFLLFRRGDLGRALAVERVHQKMAVTAVLIAIMALPNIVVFAERGDWVFPARMLDHSYIGRRPAGGPLQYEPVPSPAGSSSVFMPYGVVLYTGTFSSPWDFLQMLTPEGNAHARGDKTPLAFGRPSEAFLYVGLLGYVVALWGLAAGQHPLRRVWLLATVGFGLLMLGPSGGLQWFLRVYPPLWVVRHTHVFASFFVLGLLYFFVLGCNQLVRASGEPASTKPVLPASRVDTRWLVEVLACSLLLGLCAVLFLHVTLEPRPLPALNWEVVLVAVPLVTLVRMRRRLSGLGLFLAILLPHFALVLRYAWTAELLGSLAVFLVVPGLLLLATATSWLAPYRSMALIAAAIFLLTDLGMYVTRSSWLWHWPRPDHVLRISPLPARPEPPAPRVAVLPSEYLYDAYPQPIRYLSLAVRRPTAFSSVMYSAAEPEAFFRSAPVVLAESAWPLGDETTRTCPAGAELNMAIPIASSVRGQRVWVQLRVKSGNTVPEGVQVEADFGNRRVVRSYGNSGEWERLTLNGPAHRDQVTVVVRVRSAADASALFEKMVVRVSPNYGPPADFDPALVRAAPRWNTFIAPARYFDLVHANVPIDVLSRMLALNITPVQFRPSVTEPAQPAPRVVVRGYDYNSLRLTVDAPATGRVHVADGYDRGWRALVDGHPSPVLLSDKAFKAVGVGPGRHEIRLEYRPIPFQIALCVYFAVVGLGLCVLLVGLFRQRN